MSSLDFSFTVKILFIVVIGFLVITAWDEFLDRLLFNVFGLDRESIWTWLFIALLSTAFLFLILIIFRIEAHDILGISETVDEIITGQKESFVNGELVHTSV